MGDLGKGDGAREGRGGRAYFRELTRIYERIREELRAEGYRITRWDVLPSGPWPKGWEDARGLQVFGSREDGFRRVEVELDARDFARPIRRARVKRFTPRTGT